MRGVRGWSRRGGRCVAIADPVECPEVVKQACMHSAAPDQSGRMACAVRLRSEPPGADWLQGGGAMSGSDLYGEDILLWSEQQAPRLREMAANDRDNPNGPDWQHIIEAIEAVGRNELRACRSLLLQALLHESNAEAWPFTLNVDRTSGGPRRGGSSSRRRTCSHRPCGIGSMLRGSTPVR